MRLLDSIDRAVILIAVAALIAMMLLTTASVIGRYFLAAPIPDDLVISEFLMVFVAFLPLSAVQRAREHVFVTIFTDWMANRTKLIMETFGILIGLFIFGIIALAAFTDFYGAWETGAYVDGPLELPEAPARFVLFFGVALFALRLLLDAIASLAGLRRRAASGADPH